MRAGYFPLALAGPNIHLKPRAPSYFRSKSIIICLSIFVVLFLAWGISMTAVYTPHTNTDTAVNECSAHGNLVNGDCTCDVGWFDTDCSVFVMSYATKSFNIPTSDSMFEWQYIGFATKIQAVSVSGECSAWKYGDLITEIKDLRANDGFVFDNYWIQCHLDTFDGASSRRLLSNNDVCSLQRCSHACEACLQPNPPQHCGGGDFTYNTPWFSANCDNCKWSSTQCPTTDIPVDLYEYDDETELFVHNHQTCTYRYLPGGLPPKMICLPKNLFPNQGPTIQICPGSTCSAQQQGTFCSSGFNPPATEYNADGWTCCNGTWQDYSVSCHMTWKIVGEWSPSNLSKCCNVKWDCPAVPHYDDTNPNLIPCPQTTPAPLTASWGPYGGYNVAHQDVGCLFKYHPATVNGPIGTCGMSCRSLKCQWKAIGGTQGATVWTCAATNNWKEEHIPSVTEATSVPTSGGEIVIVGANLGYAGYTASADTPWENACEGATVSIGGVSCGSVTYGLHPHIITCMLGAGGGAAKDVVVTLDGESSTNGIGLFSYDAPAVTSVAPYFVNNPASVGTITVVGTNIGYTGLVPCLPVSPTYMYVGCQSINDSYTCTQLFVGCKWLGITVSIGGVTCNTVKYVTVPHSTPTSITCFPGAGTSGGCVTVTLDGQSSTGCYNNGPPPPIISSMSPQFSNVPTSVGTVTIVGANFGTTGATVSIGGVSCGSVSYDTAMTTITCSPGAGTSGGCVVVTMYGQWNECYNNGPYYNVCPQGSRHGLTTLSASVCDSTLTAGWGPNAYADWTCFEAPLANTFALCNCANDCENNPYLTNANQNYFNFGSVWLDGTGTCTLAIKKNYPNEAVCKFITE